MKKLLIIAIMVLQCVISSAQTIQKVSAAEAHNLLTKTNTDSLLIIDGRSNEMFQSGYLKNAINIDAYKEDLEEQLASVINRKHLFIYCTKSNRSDTIINKLSLLGYKGYIILMTEGITGWKEHEFELIVPKISDKEPHTDK